MVLKIQSDRKAYGGSAGDRLRDLEGKNGIHELESTRRLRFDPGGEI